MSRDEIEMILLGLEYIDSELPEHASVLAKMNALLALTEYSKITIRVTVKEGDAQ